MMEECTSLYDMFQQSVIKYGDNPCLGARTGKNGEYEWLTYKQVDEKVAYLGSAMASIGLGPHGRVGVYGANSPEWMMAMQACNRMNLYCVPLYDTLGENAIDYIVAHSGMCRIMVYQCVSWHGMRWPFPSCRVLLAVLSILETGHAGKGSSCCDSSGHDSCILGWRGCTGD